MDPNEVKLTFYQKIGPLLRAINNEIPLPFIFVVVTSAILSIVLVGMIPVVSNTPFIDFLVRRIGIGLLIVFVSYLVQGFFFFVIVDKIMPLIGKIKAHYEVESLETKKQLLDNVIEDEILK